MKLTNVEKQEGAKIALSILVEKEEFEPYLEKSYRRNVNRINIQGFRKGKAPRKMIEKMYGPEIFYEDAMDLCYPEAYKFAIDEAAVEPIDNPALTDFNIDDTGFSFTAVIPVKPDIEIKDYKGLEAEKAEAVVDESEVDAEIERLLDRNSRLITVERPSQDGDTVMIDFEGFVDEVAFDGGKGEGYSLKLGSGTFIPGFEEQLVGKSAGEDVDVTVTFPDPYQSEELAGKEAVFKCKVHEVKENERPVLDDEFAKDISEFDTLDEYKADLRSKMLTAKENQVNADYEEKLMDKLLEGFEGDVPEAMVEGQVDRIADDFNYRLMMQGINLEMYLQMNQMEMAAFRKMFEPRAQRQVQIRLSLEKIAELEGLEVSDAEVDAEVAKLAEQSQMTEERVLEIVRKVSIKRDLEVQRATELIKEHAKALPVTEKPQEEDEDKPKKAAPKKKAAVKKAEDGADEAAEAEDKPKKAAPRKKAAPQKAEDGSEE